MSISEIRQPSIPNQPVRQPGGGPKTAGEVGRSQGGPAAGVTARPAAEPGPVRAMAGRPAEEVLSAEERAYLEQLFPGASSSDSVHGYTIAGKAGGYTAGSIIDRRG